MKLHNLDRFLLTVEEELHDTDTDLPQQVMATLTYGTDLQFGHVYTVRGVTPGNLLLLQGHSGEFSRLRFRRVVTRLLPEAVRLP